MRTTINNKGDDDYFTRLLSYFRTQFHENIVQMVPIRKKVLLLKTDNNTYIVKGYHSNNRLKLQETFSRTLENEGFLKTYQFFNLGWNEPLFFEGTYYGCIEYIQPSKIPFSFQTHRNRLEGLELLAQYHEVTKKFVSRYCRLIPKSQLINKWKDRAELFSENQSFMKYFINEKYLAEMMEWAEWAINGMEQHHSYFVDEPHVILHGDVAHHNFLRDTAGVLHLIDFDLISIGPEQLDYLQYANRILPYLDWSYDRLMNFSQYENFQDSAFLYALGYPADIFREWNRMIREKSYTNPKKMNQIMDLTIGQFYARKKFFQTLMKKVN